MSREFAPMTDHFPIFYSEIADRFQHLRVFQEINTMINTVKKLSILGLALCVAALLAAPASAQGTAEGKTLMATFGDETGLFSLQYPAELFVLGRGTAERNGLPFPNVILVSSHTLLTRIVTTSAPPFTPIGMGDWGIAVIFFPKAMFAPLGVAPDAPILDVTKAWAKMSLTPTATTTFKPDPVALTSGAKAIVITSRGDNGAGGPAVEDNYLMLHEITDGVIALTTIVSAIDGRTPKMEAMHLALTNSIKFTGTAKDVLAMMPKGQ